MRKNKAMTTTDFARLIGLSRPTLSRYFSDPDSVRPATRKKIEESIEKHNFTPNFLASGLNRGQTRVVGVIVPSIVDSFYNDLVSQIELLAEKEGYLTVLQSSHNDRQRERKALSRLMSMDVAGIVMAPLGFNSDAAAISDARERTPLVIVDSRLDTNIPYIGTDNKQSVTLMVDYLCRSGTPPALFTMPPINRNVIERRDAYCARLVELGFEPNILNPDEGSIGDDYEQYGYERFLTLGPDRLEGVEAILCPNDRVAFGVLSAAAKLGLAVGKYQKDGIKIAGHDGQNFGRFTSPTLTTVKQDVSRMAELAVEALLHGEDHQAFREDVLLRAHLVDRDSA